MSTGNVFNFNVSAHQFNLKDSTQNVYICTIQENEDIEIGGIGQDNMYYSFSGNNVSELYTWANTYNMELTDFIKIASFNSIVKE